MNRNPILYILSKLEPKMKSGDWLRFNCPVCIYYGEPRPDSRMSGSLTTDYSNKILTYHCFRCGFKASFFNGALLSRKFSLLLERLGFSEEDLKLINDMSLLWNENDQKKNDRTRSQKSAKTYSLPKGTEKIIDLYEKNCSSELFRIIEYIISRGEILFQEYADIFYWNEKTPKLIYMPFLIRDRIVGYITKNIENGEYRLYRPRGIFFNHNILHEDYKYIIVTEGPFDAMSVNGLAVCGNRLTDEHVQLLKNLEKDGKEIIIVPDRNVPFDCDFISKAVENHWYVSIPSYSEHENYGWKKEIKDCNEALMEYGKFYTCLSIIENRTKNYAYVEALLLLNGYGKKKKRKRIEKNDITDEITNILELTHGV